MDVARSWIYYGGVSAHPATVWDPKFSSSVLPPGQEIHSLFVTSQVRRAKCYDIYLAAGTIHGLIPVRLRTILFLKFGSTSILNQLTATISQTKYSTSGEGCSILFFLPLAGHAASREVSFASASVLHLLKTFRVTRNSSSVLDPFLCFLPFVCEILTHDQINGLRWLSLKTVFFDARGHAWLRSDFGNHTTTVFHARRVAEIILLCTSSLFITRYLHSFAFARRAFRANEVSSHRK